jgi:hypothetical protein
LAIADLETLVNKTLDGKQYEKELEQLRKEFKQRGQVCEESKEEKLAIGLFKWQGGLYNLYKG